MSRQRIVVFVVATLGLIAMVGSQVTGEPQDGSADNRAEILNAQLEVITRAQEYLSAKEAAGTLGESRRGIILWSCRAVEAQRELGTKADLVKALQAHRDLLQRLLDSEKALWKAGRASVIDVWELEYRLLEARAELLKLNES